MERQAADAKYARLHEDRKWHDGTWTKWAKDASATHPYRFDFGVTVGVADTDLHPTDTFLSREQCGPIPTGEEVGGGDSS